MRKLRYIIFPVLVLLSSCNVISTMDQENRWENPFTVTVTPADSQLTVSWTPVEGAISYQVYYNTSRNPLSATLRSDATVTNTYYVLTGLANGTVHYIWVRVTTSTGTTDFGKPYTGIPVAATSPPKTPGAPVVKPGDSLLFVSWDAVQGATYYNIYDYASGTPLATNVTGLSCNLTGLTNGQIYNIAVAAGNLIDTSAYGQVVTVIPYYAGTTTGTLPTVTTTSMLNNTTFTPFIAGTSARCGGTITLSGNPAVYDRGICWSASIPYPTLSDSFVVSTGGELIGDFTCDLTGLPANTIIYIRAYATNGAGTVYSNGYVSFNTGYTFGYNDSSLEGYVFYNDGTGGGLVAALTDQTSQEWSSGVTYLGSTQLTIGSGLTNTTNISAIYTASAATICANYNSGVNSDWFLPSLDELNLMYTNLQPASSYGFSTGYYWSSSEFDTSSAYSQDFGTGNSVGQPKTTTGYSDRAIRAFSN